MNSLQKPGNSSAEPVLVREGGVPYRLSKTTDGIEAWISLMEAVEALCPRWPERAPATGIDYRL